ncbi:MAG TPA: 3-oxoacyl-[acyl-carrier-protein] synthase III C-terminal domain-containing protein [Rhabdochlamydiaceae bacterium]|nr:3-oxoacyl-[acyl-carrier-protein] synthase III C-terminal domain-containing protein [Rhabdochlamydiaceae bacterium]
MAACLTDFQIIRPEHEQSQDYLLELIVQGHAKAETLMNPAADFQPFLDSIRQRVFNLGLGIDKIQKRGYFPLSDLAHRKDSGLSEKMKLFDQEVSKVLDRFFPESQSISPHLIQVSCTGYVAPSPAQQLISKRKLGDEVSVTNAYHMGCYAAIPAIRIAQGYLHANGDASDIVHTEMCTLHLNNFVHTTEQLIVQGLFADGYIKYTIKGKPAHSPFLKILALHESIIPESTSSMTWNTKESGFHLSIAKEVPVLIARGIENYLAILAKKAKMPIEKLKKAHFAIHPGGPKIIELVANALNLSPEQISHSKNILLNYGNMSSATLPHIWEKILNDKSVQSQELIVSLAFGPGLTISGALFLKE